MRRTDRARRTRHKPGQRSHLVHRAQVATDPKARVIVAVQAEPATGHELKNCHSIERVRSRGTAKLQIQLLLAATAINLRRLASRP